MELNSCTNIGSVFLESVVSKMVGVNRLFHCAINWKIACVATAGFIIGRIILLKVFHSFEPSILAASIISRESVLSIYCFIKKTTVGAAMVGMISGTYVSISFRYMDTISCQR